ncbi:MAG: Unknown protein [uncultured Sulfurovum sp.]|uniref:NAD-dependent epimerase/dehydratase domain-containing protein n=1 Tax=uncultured Sulfurovum sp. TaxID=269237 RepID=A0A6S6RWJ5_9BACT|nr:MAG: Unknown protein [uncultured Sulfurovum sp.]
MSRTLVVGGNGYIGSHLKKRFPNFVYVGRQEFDLLNKDEIVKYCKNIQINICIVLSATISYEENLNFLEEPFTTNITGLNNLLSTLKEEHKDIKIIYFSSMTVYGDENFLPVTEDAYLAPLHSYGLSKVYAESLVKYYNLKSVIIRIPGIYGGDRKSGLIYNVISKMMQDKEVSIETQNLGYWETLHIDDMLDMFSDFLDKYRYSEKYEVFNIAYGEKTDIVETVHFIAKQLESNSKVDVTKKYKDLYLSNDKILKFINPPMTYKDRLILYINEIK